MKEQDAWEFIANMYITSHLLHKAETNPRFYGSDMKLYPNEAYTLRVIGENPGISQREISALMHRTKGSTSVVVQKLVQKGLVEIRNESLDQRVDSLYPSEKGAEIFTTHLDYDRRYIEQFLRTTGISLHDFETANEVVTSFLRYIAQRSAQKNADFT